MITGQNKYFVPVNALLALLAIFNLALTFYTCSQFYTYLPTSDTWIYTDFLAQAARGHLDVGALFIKHNNTHLIALPKLVYFLDMRLTNGSGALVMSISLVSMVATTLIFITVISQLVSTTKQEKYFLSVLSVVVLMSACQAESLMNPANLQWSLFVFTATLTAWFMYCYLQRPSIFTAAGIILGIALNTLTSASIVLILVPLLLLKCEKRFLMRAAGIIVLIVLMALVGSAVFLSEHFSLIVALSINWLKFTVNFLIPPVERLHSMAATFIAGILVLLGLFELVKTKRKENAFFECLLWFSLLVIFASGLARSYSPTAFTFRFVNVGLLFAAALFPLLYLVVRDKTRQRHIFFTVFFGYLGLLSYVNVTEASAFGYGRDHVKLTQVAHALDINDSFVVSAMPGTIWEKDDFDYVQANKHKLQEVGAGVYSSQAYKHVGTPIDALADLNDMNCKSTVIKMRRLTPEQAAYRLLGETHSDKGGDLSRVYFVDSEKIIRGYAIPILPDKNILKGLFKTKQWAGFVNLEKSKDPQSVTLYAYNGVSLCQGEKVELPAYKVANKKK